MLRIVWSITKILLQIIFASRQPASQPASRPALAIHLRRPSIQTFERETARTLTGDSLGIGNLHIANARHGRHLHFQCSLGCLLPTEAPRPFPEGERNFQIAGERLLRMVFVPALRDHSGVLGV